MREALTGADTSIWPDDLDILVPGGCDGTYGFETQPTWPDTQPTQSAAKGIGPVTTACTVEIG